MFLSPSTGEPTDRAAVAYRARWVFPVSAEPIENGTVEIERGRIVDVHQRHNPRAVDLSSAAIIPALVNAHTHLEFSDITTPLGPASPFTAWLRAVIAQRRASPAADRPANLARGVRECTAAGTTLVGEIATLPWTVELLARLKPDTETAPRIIAFWESLGLGPARKSDQLTAARKHLESCRLQAMDGVTGGISPHAPYSVHPDLFHALVDLAVEFRAPLAMHLAETQGELELLSQGTGEFVEFLQAMGVWQPDAIPCGSKPLDYLRAMARVERALAIHGNYFAEDEIAFLAAHENIAVVYCPRTHAYFGHPPHPWQMLIDRGVRLAIGTDSRASNPNLDLWEELRFLQGRFPAVDPARLLRLGTIDGAKALGLEHELGTLTPGKSADLTVVSLSPNGPASPYQCLFQEENHHREVIRRGNRIASAP